MWIEDPKTLKDYLYFQKLNLHDFARLVGISYPHAYKLVNKLVMPRPEVALRIYEFCKGVLPIEEIQYGCKAELRIIQEKEKEKQRLQELKNEANVKKESQEYS